MTRQELLQAAEANRPDLMMKTAAALSVLSRASPRDARALLEEMNEITDYTLTKVAASPVAVWGAAVGGTLLSGLAASAATDLYDAARRGLTKARNFKAIVQANPELKKYDKKRISDSFDALHRYAPEFTADPILGGTLLKAVAEVPGNEHVVIKDLLAARKNLQEAKHTQYRPGTVGIELERDADRARDETERAFRLSMENKRQGFEREMDAARAGREAEKMQRQFRHDRTLKRFEVRSRWMTNERKGELDRQLEDYKKEQGHTQYWVDKSERPQGSGQYPDYKPVVP